MNFRIILIILTTVLFSCKKPNPEEQKQHLNGYWEINTVEMPDGEVKNFGVNTIIDYIEINGDSGTRTKVSPKFDGTFNTNGVTEDFTLNIEENQLIMHYKTSFDEWKEIVVEAKDSTLVLKNRDNKTYTYNRFKKFDIVD
ncbi:lipocalin family protein [Aequorivita sp. KMM 9714]|uniref:lipocalin family protein n=1 Tax=Aequorivita sp. KMM 9714 TaxID=2707173 RepID=UPI0013EE27E7|nr:lipocalin family protein [Aequorivita sp. KMM 9714]NGX84236.1 lipocalin family protein [Aequorivita sp. KMM 9714]